MTDGTWGFAGVVIGILLTTAFGFVKSAMERRWARHDQTAELLFEHKRAAHLAILVAVNGIPEEDPTPDDLRKAIKEIQVATSILLLHSGRAAAVDSLVVERSLERWEKALSDESTNSDEVDLLYDKFGDNFARYALSARRDLGVRPSQRSKSDMSELDD